MSLQRSQRRVKEPYRARKHNMNNTALSSESSRRHKYGDKGCDRTYVQPSILRLNFLCLLLFVLTEILGQEVISFLILPIWISVPDDRASCDSYTISGYMPHVIDRGSSGFRMRIDFRRNATFPNVVSLP